MTTAIKLGVVFAILALLGGGIVWWNGKIEAGKKEAYAAGHKAALLEVAQRDNKQLVGAQAEIRRLTIAVRDLEAAHQERIAAMDEEATRRVADAEKRKDGFIRDVVTGRIRLFDPGRRRADCPRPSGGGAAEGEAVAAGSVGNGAGGTELSAEFAGQLTSEAGRADKLVEKVTYLQNYAREALRVCNAKEPPSG